ncbi:MAG: bacteriocin [Bacilli bacterium]|nr:bacteriocin [Bacilli bacterium]
MKELKEQELKNIVGGLKFSAALFSSVVKGVSLLLELGRSVGTAIRRVKTNKLC